jgi:mono/diheme cytochrome c family protein
VLRRDPEVGLRERDGVAGEAGDLGAIASGDGRRGERDAADRGAATDRGRGAPDDRSPDWAGGAGHGCPAFFRMLPALMTLPSLRTILLTMLSLTAVLALTGCGEKGIQLSKSDPLYEGASLFHQRCAGCHTLEAAGAEGSAVKVNDREYKDGPNFNQRKENYDDVLYAIQNGGFSSGPMPQNLVVGREAEVVACFVATHAGKDAKQEPAPGQESAAGSGPGDCKQRLASR